MRMSDWSSDVCSSDLFLGYLLGRSHFRFFAELRDALAAEGINDMEFYVLSTLTLKPVLTAQELAEGMAGILDDRRKHALESLVARQLAGSRSQDGVAYEQIGGETCRERGCQ